MFHAILSSQTAQVTTLFPTGTISAVTSSTPGAIAALGPCQPQFQNQFPSRERGKANWAHPRLPKAWGKKGTPLGSSSGERRFQFSFHRRYRRQSQREAARGLRPIASFPTGWRSRSRHPRGTLGYPAEVNHQLASTTTALSHLCASGLCFCFQTPAEARHKCEELTLSLPKQKPPASQQGWRGGQVPALAVAH